MRANAKVKFEYFEPYIQKMKVSYPQAKQKFMAGLLKGDRFLVMKTFLAPLSGITEDVFVRVFKANENGITGVICNKLINNIGYLEGDTVDVLDKEVINWLFLDKEGNEEGNLYGKAMDAYRSKILCVIFGVTRMGKEMIIELTEVYDNKEQSVLGILSDNDIASGKKMMKKLQEDKLKSGVQYEEGKTYYSYLVYDFIEKKYRDLTGN
ncbi:MAG: hypothetical protein M0P13_01075 [Fibrobacteraceae bacterium]|nr:hypothetical protein [Fibrobacteraceae bacterium]